MFDTLPPVTGIVWDSRQAFPGCLFAALPGARTDGRLHIPEALTKGAAALLVQDNGSAIPAYPVPCLAAADVRDALGRFAAQFYGYPSEKLKVFGITGTNGKTTTSLMLDHLFTVLGRESGLIGTIVNRVGTTVIPAVLTTPEAPDLQRLFAGMVRAGAEFCTMEVSSQGIQARRINGVNFFCGIVTNFSLEHLDCHRNFGQYLETKLSFLNSLHSSLPVVLNADDPICRRIIQDTGSQRCIFTYGIHDHNCDFRAANIRQTAAITAFNLLISPTVTGSALNLPVRLSAPGQHNVSNALAALCAVIAVAGLSPVGAVDALTGFRLPERRMQTIYRGEFTIIDDTALNPASVRAVFRALDISANGFSPKLTVACAIRGNRGPQINYSLAQTLGRLAARLGCREIITTCSRSHVMVNDRVAPDEETAFHQGLTAAGVKPRHFPELPSAIDAALQQTGRGGLLLLLGAQGMDSGADLALQTLAEATRCS